MRNNMTVKDIFALRKQGKIEEAYEAIRPIYREHKGRFTTLCMFWTASDVFKLRMEQGRVDEAEKIYEALKRLIPSIEDDEKHSAAGFMHYAEGRLIKESEKFRKRYFAIRDKKKRADIPSDIPSDPMMEGHNPTDFPAPASEEHTPTDFPAPARLCRLASPRIRGGARGGVLNHGQLLVLEAIKANEGIKVPGIEAETGIPAKSVERHIKVLIERRLIEHRGSKKTGGYHAL